MIKRAKNIGLIFVLISVTVFTGRFFLNSRNSSGAQAIKPRSRKIMSDERRRERGKNEKEISTKGFCSSAIMEREVGVPKQ